MPLMIRFFSMTIFVLIFLANYPSLLNTLPRHLKWSIYFICFLPTLIRNDYFLVNILIVCDLLILISMVYFFPVLTNLFAKSCSSFFVIAKILVSSAHFTSLVIIPLVLKSPNRFNDSFVKYS